MNINIGFFSILTLILITLKLCGVIALSWVWVTAPLWWPFALVAIILVAFAIWFGFVLIWAIVMTVLDMN